MRGARQAGRRIGPFGPFSSTNRHRDGTHDLAAPIPHAHMVSPAPPGHAQLGVHSRSDSGLAWAAPSSAGCRAQEQDAAGSTPSHRAPTASRPPTKDLHCQHSCASAATRARGRRGRHGSAHHLAHRRSLSNSRSTAHRRGRSVDGVQGARGARGGHTRRTARSSAHGRPGSSPRRFDRLIA